MSYLGFDPETQLRSVRQREAESIREADQYRLAAALPKQPAEHLWARPFRSIRVGIGQIVFGVGRAFSANETPCDDTCPDGAPC